MTNRSCYLNFFTLLLVCLVGFSCIRPNNQGPRKDFEYHYFKDSLLAVNKDSIADSINFFDNGNYDPRTDSLDKLLVNIDSLLKQLKKQDSISAAEKRAIQENIKTLDSFYKKAQKTDTTNCRENSCALYVHILRSRQILLLYINGELKDSFLVSTGIKKYKTPDLSLHPRGPMLIKYTSRKFPGGNYKGLGNMPYAIFISGGYAIHGTTPGHFAKLGSVASHGCIRLHPDNARVLFELVKIYGLTNTWIKITD